MISKEQLATVSEVFVTASVVGIGWALGGTMGAGIVAGVGINLGSDIVQKGSTYLKEKWLSRKYGVLNHDIRRALARALIKALDSLETRYFELPETDLQPNEKKKAIRGLFKELREISPRVFAASVERITTDQETKNYLYGEPQTARQELWERIEGTKLIYSFYGDHFKTFLRDNISDELVRWFGEELKNDNRESNKAWRAFQRMLLEGIQADVKMIQADQELIREDLRTLQEIELRLDQIKGVIDHRTEDEPFKKGLDGAVEKINADLETIAQTTSRTEGKVDVVVATTERVEAKIDTVVATLNQQPHLELPILPDDVQALFDEGLSLRIEGDFKEARILLERGKHLAEKQGHKFAIAKANYYQALILSEWDRQPREAKILLEQCLEDFRSEKSEIDVAAVFFNLGTLELPQGNFDEAKAYLSQSLELSRKHKKNILTASVLHQLGWLEHQRGNSKEGLLQTEEALSLFLAVYHDREPKYEKDSKHGVALCYHHLGLIHQHLGAPDEAESNLMRALEWNRKAGCKPEIAKVIWLLANMKFSEARYKEGVELLREAVTIYSELEDFLWLSRCLDLQGRLHYTLEQKGNAFEAFELALIAAAKAGDYREQVSFLVKLGRLLVTEDEADRAKECFEEARNIALREELWDSYVGAVEQLARMAHREKNVDERNRLLQEGIQKLTSLLHNVQAEPRRAYIIGRIGFLYEMIGDLQQSLNYYLRSKKAFEEFSDVGGVAKNLASIARIKGFMGDKHEEFNTYREVKQLLVGTPYHEMIADTALRLGEIQMRLGNLDEAKALLEEAEFLGRKYNLPNQNYQRKLASQLNQVIGMRKPPEKSFSELVQELFELIDWFPEAKDSILRLWLGARMEMLHSNFRSTIGVKFMLCQDDVDTFLKTAQVLHAYADLCLQAVSSEYPGTGIDLIPFPKDKDFFFECGIPYGKTLEDGSIAISFKSGGIESRYTLTSNTARSDTTGNEGVVIMGWVMVLPQQAHQLLLSSSPDELLRQKVFFLPYARHLINDPVSNDLRFGKDIGVIPVYFDGLPVSESVRVLHSIQMGLPVLSHSGVEARRRQIKKVKRAFVQLFSLKKESSLNLLNALATEAEELTDGIRADSSFQFRLYVLEFPSGLDTDTHVAIVLQSNPT